MIENIILRFENIVCDVDYNRVNEAFDKYGIKGYESFYGPGIRSGLFENFEKGKLPIYQFEDEFNAFAHTSLNLGDIDGLLRAHLNVDEEVLDILTELGVFFKTFMMGNLNPLTMQWADSFEFSLKEYPISLFFNKIYCSYQCGYLLPDWRFLDFIGTDSEIKPTETIVVDTDIKTLNIADGMGFGVFYAESKKALKDYLHNLIKIGNENWTYSDFCQRS